MESNKDIYIKHALNKHYWLSKAKELHDSAELLWNDYYEAFTEKNEPYIVREKQDTAILLMAMSLECILKGYLITTTPTHTKDGKLNKDIAIHDLKELFKIAKIEVFEYEQLFLNKLSKSIAWHGRYIIPLKFEHHVLEFHEMVVSSDDLGMFKHLYTIVLKKVESD